MFTNILQKPSDELKIYNYLSLCRMGTAYGLVSPRSVKPYYIQIMAIQQRPLYQTGANNQPPMEVNHQEEQ